MSDKVLHPPPISYPRSVEIFLTRSSKSIRQKLRTRRALRHFIRLAKRRHYIVLRALVAVPAHTVLIHTRASATKGRRCRRRQKTHREQQPECFATLLADLGRVGFIEALYDDNAPPASHPHQPQGEREQEREGQTEGEGESD